TASALASNGYRYELDAFQPCANPACSPLFTNHLQLAINDQFAPAAAFLGTALVNRNPAHVTYVLDAARNHANLGVVGDHAYWVSRMKLRDPSADGAGNDPGGKIDAISHGFGVGDPAATAAAPGAGTLAGGNLGTLVFTRQATRWGKTPAKPRKDEIDLTATNIASAAINVTRAHVSCNAQVKITSDGPINLNLLGCSRIVHGG